MPTLYLGAKREIATFAGEMRQVLSNLPVNAIDAIGENGAIKIHAHVTCSLTKAHLPRGSSLSEWALLSH
jgi:C4-dicarboxylate-specific signal transduction histidine kinase